MKQSFISRWKKVCAMAMVFAMVITLLPANTLAASIDEEAIDATGAVGDELITNGDFSNGTNYWFANNVATLNATTQNGNNVALVTDRGSTDAGIAQSINGAQEGITYRVTGRIMYNAANAADTATFNVTFQNGPDWQYRETPESVTVTKGEWKNFSFDYTVREIPGKPEVAENQKEKYILFETGWVQNPTKENNLMDFYIDDVSMVEVGDNPPAGGGDNDDQNNPTDGDEIILNGNFSNGISYWGGMDFGEIYAATVGGEAVGRATGRTGTSSGIAQDITGKVQEGVRYHVTGRIMYDAANAVNQRVFNITFQNGPEWNYRQNAGSVTVTKGQWATFDIYYTPGTSAEGNSFSNAKNYIMFETSWVPEPTAEADLMDFYIDDISIKVAATGGNEGGNQGGQGGNQGGNEGGNQTAPGEIILNGDFSAGISYWGGTDYGQVSVATINGNNVGKVTGRTITSSGIRQDISGKLEEGVRYNVTGKIMYDAANAVNERVFNVTFQNGPQWDYRKTAGSVTVRKGEWATFDFYYVPGTSTEGNPFINYQNYIMFETAWVADEQATPEADLMDFYIDDISLRRVDDSSSGDGEYNGPKKELAKKFGMGNPLISHKFGADPYAIEYNGRIYMYMTADEYQYDQLGNVVNNDYLYIKSLRVISSDDMVNWVDHGEIKVAGSDGAAKWAWHSWAPAIAYKKINGVDKFFLYFANDASGIGVLEAESPLGPWRDPIGKALITKETAGCAGVTWCFDPAVLVDDDGSAYIYFGGGIPDEENQNSINYPGTARVAKLGSDMTSIEGTASTIDAPGMFEDSGIFKYNGKYYYSYCSNFLHNVSGMEQGGIYYMVSNNPMGPFAFGGEIFKNPYTYFGLGGNNHHATFEYKDGFYFTYHTQILGAALGADAGYRSTHIDRIEMNADGTIKPVVGTYQGISQLKNFNPYEKIEAETIAWNAGIKVTECNQGTYNMQLSDLQEGDWVALSNVDFGTNGTEKITANIASQNGGRIDIRLDSLESDVVASLEVASTGGANAFRTVSYDIDKITGVHDVIFEFRGTGNNLMNVDYYMFEEVEEEVVDGTSLLEKIAEAERLLNDLPEAAKEALQEAIDDAKATIQKPGVTQAEIDAALGKLNQSYEAAENAQATEIQTYRQTLGQKIAEAEALLGDLTEAQKTALQTEINKAKVVYGNSAATLTELKAVYEPLNVLCATLKNGVSAEITAYKSLLNGKITEAETLLADLTGTAKVILQIEINAVKATAGKADATLTEVKAAVNKIDTAIATARESIPNDPVIEVDTTALRAKIAEAEELLGELSEDAKQALQSAIDMAKNILEKENVTQTSVDIVLGVLEEAYETAKATISTGGNEGNQGGTNSGNTTNNGSNGTVNNNKPSEEAILQSYMGKEFIVSNKVKYQITQCTTTTKTVTVKGLVKKNLKSFTVPATVKYNGYTFNVTEISANAFKNQKKLKTVTIGKKVTKIGKNAFCGCKKLGKIKMKGSAIKSIGKNAFKKIKKSAIFDAPKSKMKAYNKLLKKAKTSSYKVK